VRARNGITVSATGSRIVSGPRPSERRKTRRLLVQALYQWHLAGDSIRSIEAQFFADDRLRKADEKYFSDLLRAIPLCVDELDQEFGVFLDRKQKALDPVSLTILRIATYELLHRLDLPYKIAINEAISLAKIFGPTDADQFINGVIDKVAHNCRLREINAAKVRV
jgi:transcription antitermination protein NusB